MFISHENQIFPFPALSFSDADCNQNPAGGGGGWGGLMWGQGGRSRERAGHPGHRLVSISPCVKQGWKPCENDLLGTKYLPIHVYTVQIYLCVQIQATF
jgi:hypothetical protein